MQEAWLRTICIAIQWIVLWLRQGSAVLQYSHCSSDTARRRWAGRAGAGQALRRAQGAGGARGRAGAGRVGARRAQGVRQAGARAGAGHRRGRAQGAA